ncbi:hypothetical protein M2277_004968 [Paenibacillus sp. LBL]|uniref:hypothetical protein n=1 Tax=Paenibacillus sp. LBL TaxID=2940563 RepID=UPI002473674B|nr:hypothetical protein [Paenibacillus sp. LBL]MDH6674276.1 hypothetical protein [Paenibacillus sp. LBL]
MNPFFEVIATFEWEELDGKVVEMRHIVFDDGCTLTAAYDMKNEKIYILDQQIPKGKI